MANGICHNISKFPTVSCLCLLMLIGFIWFPKVERSQHHFFGNQILWDPLPTAQPPISTSKMSNMRNLSGISSVRFKNLGENYQIRGAILPHIVILHVTHIKLGNQITAPNFMVYHHHLTGTIWDIHHSHDMGPAVGRLGGGRLKCWTMTTIQAAWNLLKTVKYSKHPAYPAKNWNATRICSILW